MITLLTKPLVENDEGTVEIARNALSETYRALQRERLPDLVATMMAHSVIRRLRGHQISEYAEVYRS